MHIRISNDLKAELNSIAKDLGLCPGTYARSLIIKGLRDQAKAKKGGQ
jgi:hypothetical protein